MTRRFVLLLVVGLAAFVLARGTTATSPYVWSPVPDLHTYEPAVPATVPAESPATQRALASPAASKRAPSPRPSVPRPAGATLSGRATFYAYHRGQAAAGWALRRFLGPNWRGTRVTVCARACIRVVLTDYESSTDHRKIIDLDSADFAALAGDLGLGVIEVTVSR